MLLSTHILSEVQAICNDIKMIDSGHFISPVRWRILIIISHPIVLLSN